MGFGVGDAERAQGFYAGYYMTFFSGALVTTVARSTLKLTFPQNAVRRHTDWLARCPVHVSGLRQIVRPRFLKADGKTGTSAKIVYDVVGWFVTMNTLNYICTSFVLLSWSTSLQVYASLYYFIHIATIILLLLSYVVPVKKEPRAASAAKPVKAE